MKVNLGTFALLCAEGGFGPALGTAVDSALRFYERRLAEGHPPPGVPRFLLGEDGGEGTGTELEVAPEFAQLLRRESARQQVEVDDLVGHVVFVYFAHLETAV